MNDRDILKASIEARKEAERIKSERLKKGIVNHRQRLQDKMAEQNRPH